MYRPRIVDHELTGLLESIGAVVIEGPKASGKTETARQVAASEVRLDVDPSALQAASIDPSLLLGSSPPPYGTTCAAPSTTEGPQANSS